MSGYVLCRTRMAEVPYYIKNISMNVYSVEELCYYLFHNVYLVDESLMDTPLFDWLDGELCLTALAHRLRILQGKYAKPYEYVIPIFKEINYLTYEELRTLRARLNRLASEPILVRMKLKGDSLVENGIYVSALRTYQDILEELHQGKEEPRKGFLGSIYHNMGCVYSYLFQKEEALNCFEKAYHHLHTKGSLKSYLCTFADTRTPIEYSSKLAELGVDVHTAEEIEEEMQKAWEMSQVPVYSRDIDGILEELTKEYHKGAGS